MRGRKKFATLGYTKLDACRPSRCTASTTRWACRLPAGLDRLLASASAGPSTAAAPASGGPAPSTIRWSSAASPSSIFLSDPDHLRIDGPLLRLRRCARHVRAQRTAALLSSVFNYSACAPRHRRRFMLVIEANDPLRPRASRRALKKRRRRRRGGGRRMKHCVRSGLSSASLLALCFAGLRRRAARHAHSKSGTT